MNIKETTQYDNYLDKDKRVNDDYKATLDKYVGDEIVKTNAGEEREVIDRLVYITFSLGPAALPTAFERLE